MPDKQPAQIDKFRDLARELETDDDEARFDERLKKLASAPHNPKPKDVVPNRDVPKPGKAITPKAPRKPKPGTKGN